MSEEKSDQIEKMLELVLKEMSVIKSTMATKEDIVRLDNKIVRLDSKVVELDSRVAGLDNKIDALDAKVERYGQAQQEDVYGLLSMMDKKLTDIREDIKSLTEVIGDHEIRIRTLFRQPV